MEKSCTNGEIEADPYKCLPGIRPMLDCTGEDSSLKEYTLYLY